MDIPGLRGVSPGEFGKRLGRSLSENAVTDSAAELAYYLLYSAFPFLFFVVTLAAYVPVGSAVNAMMARLQPIIPAQAFGLIHQELDALLHQPRPRLLTLGLATAIYSASRGVDAMRTALNRAYKVPEGRSYLHTQAVSVGMTLAGTMLVVVAVTGIILGSEAGRWIFERAHLERGFAVFSSWMRWPVTAVVITLTAALGYYFLPDVKQRFKFITPGSVLATAFWLIATYGFTFYTAHFSKVNVTYGSLGGVILMMTWFYLSGLIFISGGVLNALVEHASVEGKAEGAKDVGEPSPSPEQRALAQSPGAAKRRGTAEGLRQLFHRRRARPS